VHLIYLLGQREHHCFDLVGASGGRVVLGRLEVTADGLLDASRRVDVVVGQEVVHFAEHFGDAGAVAIGA
jgi:hypothetical protein